MNAIVRASDLPGTIGHLLRFVGLGLTLYSLRTAPGRLFVGSTLLAISPIALIVGLVALGEGARRVPRDTVADARREEQGSAQQTKKR